MKEKRCKDCRAQIFTDVNMVMVKDSLWNVICDHSLDDLCDRCMEYRLGRRITTTDFKEAAFAHISMIPCNQFWLQNKLNERT